MALVGSLKDLKLANIIQINCIERNVAKVTVKNVDVNGSIYFSNGAIIHAEFGAYIGERAVHEMLALSDGEFKVEAGVESPSQTISRSWNSVVLEGLRLLDEKEAFSATLPRQLFALLSGLKNVHNVFVLNANGQIVEGKASHSMHPLSLTFVCYKLKKMLNLFYSDTFQYIMLRKKEGYYFIFEFRSNVIVIETDLKVITSEFTTMVKKVLKQVNRNRMS